MTAPDTLNGSHQRSLKVEHLDGADFTPSGKSLIRLKGKWLAAILPPGGRVSIEVADGAIVIRQANPEGSALAR
jgi:hypothetical protein